MSSNADSPLFIIVPCYNEQEVLPDSLNRLSSIASLMEEKLGIKVMLLLVDDGSRDETWFLIKEAIAKDDRVRGIRLAHNAGHQNALWAGMEAAWEAGAGSIVSIDADLQDDVKVIPRMASDWLQGSDVVLGVRKERTTDSAFKRGTAQAFYRLMEALGSEMVYNHADFRLLSRRALQALLSCPERNLFLRGMVPMLGFNVTTEYYDREKRTAGKTKYPLSKMLSFAVEGVTSFSVKPLRLIMAIGFLFVLISIIAIIWAIDEYSFHNAMQGWTSLLISIWLVGGVVLMALGVVGIYVGKVYTEVKRRPRYFEMERAGW